MSHVAFALALAFAGAFALAACGDTMVVLDRAQGGVRGADGAVGDGAGVAGGPSTVDDGGASRLPTYQHASCSNGGSTTISGTVYDPANVNPVYNATVYVPSNVINNVPTAYVPGTPLPPLPNGIACGSCANLYYAPDSDAVTDATGHFSIRDAPNGARIPLIVQTGKWRMLYTISNVVACEDNPQPDHSLRLPKNHLEGDLPNIAISTGAADSLECLLLRMGVDPGEYVGGAGGAGRVHIFTGHLDGGSGAVTGASSPDPSTTLWDSDTDLDAFDVVLLSCEGGETANMNQQALWNYANGGGRVFASHFHYAWFDTGPFATTGSPALATWTMGAQPLGNINANIVTTLPNGKEFTEGVALGKWLGAVGALGVNGAPSGELPIVSAFGNAAVTANSASSQPWIVADPSSPAAQATEYFSFDTPLIAAPIERCGRVVYSDLHASSGEGSAAMTRGSLPADYAGNVRVCPDQCAVGPLTPQEKALEFMIFNLSSCLTPPGGPSGLLPTPLPTQPKGS